jgi:hypothetical protein
MNVDSARSLVAELRRLWIPFGFAVLLPMPLLLGVADAAGVDMAIVYLALGVAWLASEAFREGGEPLTFARWKMRMIALSIFAAADALIFTILGGSAGMKSNIPLVVLSVLGVTPALGLVPWLTLRLGQPHCAIVLGASIVGAIKIAACGVARIVYGPDFITLGYVAGDWQTAKLMISVMWAGTVAVSILGLIACSRRFPPA